MLGLWYRPAAAASVRPLVWELPHAAAAALKRKKKKILKQNKKPDFGRYFLPKTASFLGENFQFLWPYL